MISRRAQEIPPFIVMDVLEKAQQMERAGIDVVHLEIGEPDFDTPECIKLAAKRALDEGQTHYTHSQGIPALRAAISQDYQQRYGVEVDSDNIIVTSGTSPAMLMIFSTIMEPGDEVIFSNPHYACYPNFVNFLGGRPVFVNVWEDDGFQLRPEDVAEKVTPRTRAIFINSPANPTGQLLSPERMRALTRLGPPVISDEIYHGLVYGGQQEHSILEFSDSSIVINGFSKLYAMTGWRLGYIIAPREYIRPMQKIQQNFFIAASSIAQAAGVAALGQAAGDVARMRAAYDQRRVFLIQGLRRLGFRVATEPFGAFYVLVNASHLNENSLRLAEDILEKAHVGVCPGIDFGTNAEGYLRFSYASSTENIAEGLARLERYLGAFKAGVKI